MGDQRRTIMLSIDTEGDGDFTKAFEIAGRTAAGLILDGLDCRLSQFVDTEEGDGA